MLARPSRRALLLGAGSVCLLPWSAVGAADKLNIGGARGSIDFAIGDSRVFRTTGSFKDWQGFLRVDDQDVPKSAVQVTVHTKSVQMLDTQQTAMMKDADFFDVERFPEMTFQSTAVERTAESTLKVSGNVTYQRNYPQFVADDTLGPVGSTIHVDAGGMRVEGLQQGGGRRVGA